MYSDLSDYLLVNKKLLRVFGFELAIYWPVLEDIIRKVLQKKDRKPLVDEEGYFTVDRDYISVETGLSLEQQFNCDSILERAGVVLVGKDRNKLIPDLQKMVDIIVSDDQKYLQSLSKKAVLPKGISERNAKAAKAAEELVTKELVKEKKTMGQKFGAFKVIEKHPIAADSDLVELLHAWVDSVYERKLFLNGTFVNNFCDAVCKYSTNKDVRKGLVETAVMYGYREFNYVLDRYLQNQKVNPTNTKATQKVSNGVIGETF